MNTCRLPSRTRSLAALAAVLTLAGSQDHELPTGIAVPEEPRFVQAASGPTVTSLADQGGGVCDDTECTLREAITFAESGATITFVVTGTITLDSKQLTVDKDLTISGPGADRLSVARSSAEYDSRGRIISIEPGITVTMSGLAVTGAGFFYHGGGIENGGTLTLSHSTVSGFSGGVRGSGIQNYGTLTLSHSTVSGNHSFSSAIYNSGTLTLSHSTVSGNSTINDGGGIYNAGTATLLHSTVSGNSADNLAGGGGILSSGSGSRLMLQNSTVSGNRASSWGGGIASLFGGVVTLQNSTVSGNSAGWGGGGIDNAYGGVVTLQNSILANSTGGDCSRRGGSVIDNGYNLVEDGSCLSASTSRSGDPLLDALALNAPGTTETHALLEGSPALDAIPNGTNGCGTDITIDQRGIKRPQGSACDIGAYELEQAAGFVFSGFFAPVDNLPVLNKAKAGSAIPVKFSLGGDWGLDIFASGYPRSDPIACDAAAPADAVTETVSAGGSSLSYDAVTDRYTYVWKTDKKWAGSCRQLTLKLSDGSEHQANFQFRK